MDETRIRALVKRIRPPREYCSTNGESYCRDRSLPEANSCSSCNRWRWADELDAALQAASPVPRVEWQPIETAPVGTQVWAWDDERGSNPAMLVDGEWHITYDDAIIHPKYWQHLPDHPSVPRSTPVQRINE
jgi:hypothetical protein